jgi:SAM-dependent methyltransferase
VFGAASAAIYGAAGGGYAETAVVNIPDPIRAGSFGLAAREYEHGRPSYPPAAVDWLLPDGQVRVLDLAAGTGKLTRQIVARGLEVVAVEPSEAMRNELERALPGVTSLAGSAEGIPLADGSVDVVLVAQAWHWVDTRRAVRELARVLSPGGRLGLVWNVRDQRESWVAQLDRIMHREIADEINTTNPPVGPPFKPIERFDVEWTYKLNRQTLLDLVSSRSYIITLPDDQRAMLLDDVRELLARDPALAGRGEIGMPYITRCSRTELT